VTLIERIEAAATQADERIQRNADLIERVAANYRVGLLTDDDVVGQVAEILARRGRGGARAPPTRPRAASTTPFTSSAHMGAGAWTTG
jgi:hypothetical protein